MLVKFHGDISALEISEKHYLFCVKNHYNFISQFKDLHFELAGEEKREKSNVSATFVTKEREGRFASGIKERALSGSGFIAETDPFTLPLLLGGAPPQVSVL